MALFIILNFKYRLSAILAERTEKPFVGDSCGFKNYVLDEVENGQFSGPFKSIVKSGPH